MLEQKDGLWHRFIGGAGHSAIAKRKTLVSKTLKIFEKHSAQTPLSAHRSHFNAQQIQEELLEITGEHKALSPIFEQPKSIANALGLTGRCLDTHPRTTRGDHRKGLNRWFGQADNAYDQYLQKRITTKTDVPYLDEEYTAATNSIALPDFYDEPQESITSATSVVVFEAPSAPIMELVSNIPELEDLLARLQMLEGNMQTSMQESMPEPQQTSLHLVADSQLPQLKQKQMTRDHITQLKQQNEEVLSAV